MDSLRARVPPGTAGRMPTGIRKKPGFYKKYGSGSWRGVRMVYNEEGGAMAGQPQIAFLS
ncbi:hypothetical protein [Ethanoligenens harbinense]|uniref:hypothetical protein n=1 Tax=Ethanoligenens harbinense TaxID=253239 RepID=UPI0002F3BE83|nr:hypothetical protein [Ethanoligenens harbinense]